MAEELRLPIEVLAELGYTVLEPPNNRVVKVMREPGSVRVWLEFDLDELDVIKILTEAAFITFKGNVATIETAERIFNDIKGVY